jgi:nucleotide-binding universal stress UspA family protein
MFKRILVAVDGSAVSNRALGVAIGLAKEQGAVLHLVHVVEDTTAAAIAGSGVSGWGGYVVEMYEALRETGRKVLAKAEADVAKTGQTMQTHLVDATRFGVAQVILRLARRVHADIIVMGTHGRRGLSRLVMGSDAETVLREARVPVLLVRAAQKTPVAVKPRSRASASSQARRPRVTRQGVRPQL